MYRMSARGEETNAKMRFIREETRIVYILRLGTGREASLIARGNRKTSPVTCVATLAAAGWLGFSEFPAESGTRVARGRLKRVSLRRALSMRVTRTSAIAL